MWPSMMAKPDWLRLIKINFWPPTPNLPELYREVSPPEAHGYKIPEQYQKFINSRKKEGMLSGKQLTVSTRDIE